MCFKWYSIPMIIHLSYTHTLTVPKTQFKYKKLLPKPAARPYLPSWNSHSIGCAFLFVMHVLGMSTSKIFIQRLSTSKKKTSQQSIYAQKSTVDLKCTIHLMSIKKHHSEPNVAVLPSKATLIPFIIIIHIWCSLLFKKHHLKLNVAVLSSQAYTI